MLLTFAPTGEAVVRWGTRKEEGPSRTLPPDAVLRGVEAFESEDVARLA